MVASGAIVLRFKSYRSHDLYVRFKISKFVNLFERKIVKK